MLGQAEKSSRLLNFPPGTHQRADFNTKLNLNLNRFIKANEFRNRKLQIQKKLKEFGSEESEEMRRRNLRAQKADDEIQDLKMRRLYHQIKLKLFYLDLLATLGGPATHDLTAPEVVRRLWRIKGRNHQSTSPKATSTGNCLSTCSTLFWNSRHCSRSSKRPRPKPNCTKRTSPKWTANATKNWFHCRHSKIVSRKSGGDCAT